MMFKTKDGLKFRTKPWKHQLEALRYIMSKDSAGLFLGMGCGKTKIIIDLINNKDFRTVLVICPLRVAGVWEEQLPIHSFKHDICAYNLCSLSAKSKVEYLRENHKSNTERGVAVYIVNYDSVWREPFRNYIKDKIKWDAIICDESHRIKSPSSKVSKFLKYLGKRCKNRYIATGTPLAQSPLDIYGQYRFLNPEIFGTNYNDFCNQYQNVDIKKSMKVGYPILDKKEPYKNMDDLHNKMMSCSYYTEVNLDLPPTQDIDVEFTLSKKAQEYYREIRDEGVLELQNGVMEVNNALSLTLRLQQLVNGYVKVEDEKKNITLARVDDSRRQALKDLLEDFPQDEPIVVFTKFKVDVENVRQVCKELKRKCSELSGNRDELSDWKKGESSILITQIQAGAEGIDLTRARYVIYYSQTVSLSQYQQSRKRTHRPGQTRPVVYYTLIAKMDKGKTVDRGIVDSNRKNEDFIKSVMNRKTI